MFKWIKNKKSKSKVEPLKKESRLEQMKKNPYKRVDSENMTDIEKMDRGFTVSYTHLTLPTKRIV